MNFSNLTLEELKILYELLQKITFMSGRSANTIHIMNTAIQHEILRRQK